VALPFERLTTFLTKPTRTRSYNYNNTYQPEQLF